MVEQAAESALDLGASAASAAGTANNFGNSAALASTKDLETTVKEGMSLIDRFYNGGNRARPAALDILVVVLDGVVRRMRQSYSTRQAHISDGNAEIAQIDKSIAAIKKRQDPLHKELADKKARAQELRAAVAKGEETITDSVEVARKALEKASLLTRHIEKDTIAGLKLTLKGYDGKGKPIAGREVNLRKTSNRARKPGDMAPTTTAADDAMLLARAKAVMNGEPLPGK